jgi:hypothetical protein
MLISQSEKLKSKTAAIFYNFIFAKLTVIGAAEAAPTIYQAKITPPEMS